MVGHEITVHVPQGVLENGTWHGHVQVVARVNTDLDGVWQQNLLAAGKLSDHVVGSREKTGFVERTSFNHGAGERSDTDEQSGSVERTRSFKQSSALKGLPLTGFCITVGTGQGGRTLGGEGTHGVNRTLQTVGWKVAGVVHETEGLVSGHYGVGFVVKLTIDHIAGLNPRSFDDTVS